MAKHWKMAAGPLTVAALLAVWALTHASRPVPVGTSAPPAPAKNKRSRAPAVQLWVHATRRAEGAPDPIRLVAELPDEETQEISLRDSIQFGYRVRGPRHALILGVDEMGGVHYYYPSDPALLPTARADAATEETLVRPAVDVAARHHIGLLRIFGVFSTTPIDASQLAQAVQAVTADLTDTRRLPVTGEQASGLFRIVP